MTFAAVGSLIQGTSSSVSLSNQGVGNLVVIIVLGSSNTVYCSSISGGSVTWSAAGSHSYGTNNSWSAQAFTGVVTATGSHTATLNWSGTAPSVIHADGHEYTSTSGSWSFDALTFLDLSSPGSNTFPSVTPAGANELYYGYCITIGSPAAGSASGYTYTTDTPGNGACWNPACGTGAQAPAWQAGSDFVLGMALMVKETGPVTSSDSGAGTDAGSVLARISDQDYGTGTDSQSVAAGNVHVSGGTDSATGHENQFTSHPFSSDSGAATDAQLIYRALSSSDSGAAVDSQLPPGYSPRDFDGATGYDSAFYEPLATTGITGVAMEGFSLTRASVLGATGLESAQLYAAQAITLTPTTTVINNSADDEVLSIWVILNSADLAIQGGFMPFSVLAQLGGTALASSGLSPADYYGLPLWTQYQHNQPQVPMAIRMASRNSPGAARTMDIVLYRVSIAVLDFTGVVYKTGLQVNYQGKIMFSNTDEAGNDLAGPEMGRIVSYAGSLTGAFASLPFRGI
jgi:hypothetical protein